nr:MAG TPA: hypothetical protein [Caudoviricetes sp.]DAW83842.1 MAG TPA: hypothetical protein [Bacteriophage sp.]
MLFLVPFIFCHNYTLLCICELIVITHYTTHFYKMEEYSMSMIVILCDIVYNVNIIEKGV